MKTFAIIYQGDESLVDGSSAESEVAIIVPEDKVEEALEYLLNHFCEIHDLERDELSESDEWAPYYAQDITDKLKILEIMKTGKTFEDARDIVEKESEANKNG